MRLALMPMFAVLTSAHLFANDVSTSYDFEGIVKLSNCSGSLVKLENSLDNDKAMILTNGHCLESGFPDAGEIVYRKPNNRRFRLLDPQGNPLAIVTATEIIYATMTKTDMALYRLKETYAEIKSKHNIRPLLIGNAHPAANEAIQIISGYWQRGYSCAIETFVTLLREDQWTSEDSIRYSRPGCETIGGTSGSPVIRAGTREIIGINSTGNEDGLQCSMNNPCEVDAAGNISFVKGYSYGDQTYWIYSCLNADNELDLSTPGCMLHH